MCASQKDFKLQLTICQLPTLDSGINVAPGITVAPPLRNFHIMILILLYINLGIAVIFIFFSSKFSKINKRSPMFILESRVRRLLCGICLLGTYNFILL